MPAVNDGNAPFGAQVITVVGAGNYVAENIVFTQPSTVVERRDEDGDPNAQVVVPGFDNGTMTLQLATTLSTAVTRGATFSLIRNGGATISCMIVEIGEPQDQMEIRKLNVAFRRKYN